ncbi:methyl-accepting chemotaxis protein [Celeribacter marinus]|uniref:methyl-accepting chemotaxis protein n=1 Tax=Celeribacter marinus TaxID=1397108 RepID=UPI0031755C86
MSEQTQTFESTQAEAVKVLGLATLAISVVMVAFIIFEKGNVVLALGGAVLFSAVALIAGRLPARTSRILTAQALVGTAITFNAALMGHALQIDSHMLYFAVLAMIVAMNGIRALLLAAGTIAVHHLVLTFAMPALVYPTLSLSLNIERTLMHAVIVVMETAALAYMIIKRIELNRILEEGNAKTLAATEDVRQALASAQQEKTRAEAALTEAQKATEQAAESGRVAQDALRSNEEAQQERDAMRADEERARTNRDQALAHLLDVFGRHLDQLSSGDLSTRISTDLHPDYEGLRTSFNDTVTRLGHAMKEVREQSGSMQVQSGEIAASANDLSTRTERQAAALANIAQSVQELNASLNTVAVDSADARKLAEATSGDAAEGSAIMEQAVRAMRGIEESSNEINKITGVIDDIAFQTNLLALNAGVEAARAGEAGRGFAVVASEVRALAQRSSDAAREINLLIEKSSQQVSSGADLVDKTGQALGGIKESVDKITRRLQSSADAMTTQSRQLSDVNTSISELEGVTQQNTAMFEETTAANSLLSNSAQALSDMVSIFVTDATIGMPMTGENDGYAKAS